MHFGTKVVAFGAASYGVMYVAASLNMVPSIVKRRVKPSQYLALCKGKQGYLHGYTLVAKSSLLGLTWSDAFATFDLSLFGDRSRLIDYQVLAFDGFAMSDEERTTRMFEGIDAQAKTFGTKLEALSHNQVMRNHLEQHGFVLTEEDFDSRSTELLAKVLA